MRRMIAALLAVMLLASLMTTTASAASSVETSGVCTVTTGKQAWWDIFGLSRPKVTITNKSGRNILIYAENGSRVNEVNGASLKKGKSTDIKLKFNQTYTIYATGGIYTPYTQKIQVKAKNNISGLW